MTGVVAAFAFLWFVIVALHLWAWAVEAYERGDASPQLAVRWLVGGALTASAVVVLLAMVFFAMVG